MGYCTRGSLGSRLFGSRIDGRRVAVWGGSGGSWVFNDLDARMTVAYVMNKHVEGPYDQRGIDFVNLAYDSLALAA